MSHVTRTMSKELLRLAQEVDALGMPLPKGGIVPLRRQMTWIERVKNAITLFFKKKEPEHDRVWVGVVDSEPHVTNVLIPASGGWTAPAEFARVINVACPCPMMLVRDASGRVGSVQWNAPKEYRHLPVAAETARVLKANVNIFNIEWHADLGHRLSYNIDWAVQILPADDNTTLLVMRTAAIGAKHKRLGFGVFHKLAGELEDALALVQSRPAIHPFLRLLAPTDLAAVKALSERKRATRMMTRRNTDTAVSA